MTRIRIINKMQRGKGYIIVILLSMLLAGSTTAQIGGDSLILAAMHDELDRNIQKLRTEEYDNPFFIAYTIADARFTQISASLGALNYSQSRNYKDWHVRLMAGDYKINDENFRSTQPDDVIYRQNIQMPVENDYEGIRRSLWLTTNNLFFSASRTYKNKMALIEDKQIRKSDLEIEDFSREKLVHKKITNPGMSYNPPALEERARYLSGIFSNKQEVFASSVRISVFESTVYFINSEGSEVQFPLNLAILSVQAQSMADDSDPLNKTITYIGNDFSAIPDDPQIASDINKMLDNLVKLKSTPRFEDDYFGPVLVIGEVAAETFEKFLFSGSDALIASRETLQSGNQQSVYYAPSSNNLQNKLGKPVLSKDLTVTAEPTLKEYKGLKLLGSYSVDAEAVLPPDTLVLIKKGILKTLLNGRTPSREVPNSNGHMRMQYSMGGLNKTVGPGVVRIRSDQGLELEELKKELMSQAEELGLDYAIMIKSLDVEGMDKPFNFYKVNVQTGEEELTRAVRLRNLSLYSLRRSPLFSSEELVHNTLLPVAQQSMRGPGGIPSTFILPEAMLLREIELESYRKPLTSLLPIIDNPVGNTGYEKKALSAEEKPGE